MKGLIDFEPEEYYHIVNHAVGSENLFRTEENYRYFLDKYAHYSSSVFTKILLNINLLIAPRTGTSAHLTEYCLTNQRF